MQAMPSSHLGLRSRSVRMRRLEETRLGLLLGGVLLQHEADAEQNGGHKRGRVVHIQVHGALSSTRCTVCGYQGQRAPLTASFGSAAWRRCGDCPLIVR